MKEKNNSRGITLIALVVTIIVLLILAGITIAMLTGQNGILNRATEARDANGIAQIDEQVKLAVAEALSNGLGTITEDNLRAALDNNVGAGNYELSGDAKNGWTIKAGGKEYKISGNGDISGGDNTGGNNGGTTGDKEENSLGGIYSESGITEEDIAPNDLFEYEILNNESKTASNVNTNLPTKTAKITRIKRQYCNFGDNKDIDTNYEIRYNGITDTLVIPYVVGLTNPDTGKMESYTITGVNLSFGDYTENQYRCNLPSIENIVYPNTVTKIYGDGERAVDHGLKKVILSDNIEEIPSGFFWVSNSKSDYRGIEKVHLPKNLKKIGKNAFRHCIKIKSIDLTGVETIESDAFEEWGADQRISVPYKRNEEIPTGWSPDWGGTATIMYLGEKEPDISSGIEVNAKQIASNKSKFYGKRITNYKASENDTNIYRIFYVSESEEFGDEPYTIYLKADYLSYGQTLSDNYLQNTKVKEMNPIWAEKRGDLNDKWNENEKKAAYLCSPVNGTNVDLPWKSFYDGGKIAKYVIGSPSVEMFLKSYNQVVEDWYGGWSRWSAIYNNGVSGYGYKYSARGSSINGGSLTGKISPEYNNIYCGRNGKNKGSWWLSSPYTSSNMLCAVGNTTLYSEMGSSNMALSPIIALKQNVNVKIDEREYEKGSIIESGSGSGSGYGSGSSYGS